MAGRALVLGGGGTVGLAWEAGLLRGLQEGGADVTDADLIVGTSAGSLAGMRVAHGDPLDALLAEQLELDPHLLEETNRLSKQIDFQSLMQIMGVWIAPAGLTPETRAQIGALAVAAKAPSEDEYLPWIRGFLKGRGWPKRRIVVTGVDAATGELVAWSSENDDGGVPADRAVAASCAVPGMWPPVTIDGRRYVDGGVVSATNATLAKGSERVLIIAPIGSGSDPLSPSGKRDAEQEVAALRDTGSAVSLIFPDEQAVAAFGPILMAPDKIGPAAREGLRQGREAAASVAAFWRG